MLVVPTNRPIARMNELLPREPNEWPTLIRWPLGLVYPHTSFNIFSHLPLNLRSIAT